MKRMLAFLLSMLLLLSMLSAGALATEAPTNAYTRMEVARLLVDVLGLKYHEDMAEWAYSDLSVDTEDGQIGAMMSYYSLVQNGDGSYSGNFGPNDTVPRADMAMILKRALPLKYSTDVPVDVEIDYPFGPSVAAVVAAGLMDVDENGRFNYTEPTLYGDLEIAKMRALVAPVATAGDGSLTASYYTVTGVAELELYYSASGNGNYQYVAEVDSRDDTENNWAGRTYTWIPDTAVFAQYGTGWYYVKDSNGYTSQSVNVICQQEVEKLTAPTNVMWSDNGAPRWTFETDAELFELQYLIVDEAAEDPAALAWNNTNQDDTFYFSPESYTDATAFEALDYMVTEWTNDCSAGEALYFRVRVTNYDETGNVLVAASDWVYSTPKIIPYTRMEVAYLLVDLFGWEYDGTKMTKTYPDLTDSKDAEVAAILYYHGIMRGTQYGTFDPEGNVTRAEMAKLLTEALDLPAGDIEIADIDGSEWYAAHVKSTVAAELMITDDSNSFYPGSLLIPGDMDVTKIRKLATPKHLTEFHWDTRYSPSGRVSTENGCLSFNALPGQRYMVEYYRVDPNGGDDISVWDKPTTTTGQECGYACTSMFAAPRFVDNFVDGTYYVMITPVNAGENSTAVKSPVWQYTRPDTVFEVSNPRWGENNTLFWDSNITNTTYLKKYTVEVQFNAKSDDPYSGTTVERLKFFPDEDIPPYVLPESVLEANGPGWYFFQVLAETADVTQALNKDFTDYSPALKYDEASSAGSTPTNFRWDRYFWNDVETDVKGYLTFDGAQGEQYLVQFFKEADHGETSDTFLFGRTVSVFPGESSVSINLFMNDLNTPVQTGTYYAAVTPLGDGQTTGKGEPVVSPAWKYVRPAVTLTTSAPKWDETNKAATWTNGFTDDSTVERYWVRYYCNPTANDVTGAEYVNGQNYLPTENPPYVIPENILTAGGDGWYFFTVQAWSKDVTMATSANPSNFSSGLYFDAPDPDLSVTSPAWGDGMTLTWTDTSLKPEAVDRYYVIFARNPNNNSVSGAQNISGYNYYAKNAPHTIPKDTLPEGGTGWWFFKVMIRATTASGVADSMWSDWSDGYYYNPDALPQLPAPNSLKWNVAYASNWENGELVSQTAYDRKGTISFKRPVDEDGEFADLGEYAFEIYRIENGEPKQVGNPGVGIGNNSPEAYVSCNSFVYSDFPSGTYFFKVRCLGDEDTCSDSEWATSDTWEYTAPADRLTTPTGLFWDTDTDFTGDQIPDIASVWAPVENADYYFVQYYWSETENGKPQYLSGSQDITCRKGDDPYTLLSKYLFSKKGEGWYFFTVQAVPADIEEYCISEWSALSKGCYLASTLPAAPKPENLQWHIGYDWDGDTYKETGRMSFTGTVLNNPPFIDYTIELFREEDEGDVSLGTVDYTLWADRTFGDVDVFAFFADALETGTYYFTVTALPLPGFHAGSAPVYSEKWTYTRPDSELKVYDNVIKPNLSVDWIFDGDLDMLMDYEVEFGYASFGEKLSDNSPYWGNNHDHFGPPLYVPEDFLEDNGDGKYFFRVRARSHDPEEAVPSEWTDWYGPVDYTEPNAAFTVSNPGWNSKTPEWTDNVQQNDPFLFYQIRYYYGKTADSINYDRCILDTTYDSLPVELPDKMVEVYEEGYYTFKVNVVSADLSQVKSSGWSEASPVYKLNLTTAEVNNQLDQIAENTSAADIQQAVADIKDLDKAMAADAETGSTETLDKLADLEEKVKTELNVDSMVEVADNLAERFGGSLEGLSFTAVNMALNVDPDKADGESKTTVQLNIAAAEETVQPDAARIDTSNALVFSMDIVNVADVDDTNDNTDLMIPVQITLPIPGNINPNFLVILHEKSDGEWEELTLPHVFQDAEGQWYATFSVTSFSNYAMGEKALTAKAEGKTITLKAHLSTSGVQTQYLCAVYSVQGQMLGMGVLQPQSDDALVITLAQDVPEDATMQIFAPDTGAGWTVHSAPASVTIVW